MLADADTYDDIKQVVMTCLKMDKCTSCGTITWLWVWHFLCPNCAREYGYDQWTADSAAWEIAALLAEPQDVRKRRARELPPNVVEAWLGCHGMLNEGYTITVHFDGLVLLENDRPGLRRVFNLSRKGNFLPPGHDDHCSAEQWKEHIQPYA